jgi:superfamily II RNA helicase
MSFVNIPPSTAPADFPSSLALVHPYPLDPWQQHGVAAIHRGEHVLVTANTGAGKTTIMEYQIAYCLAKNERAFVLAPIKPLSNQKWRDLRDQLKDLFPTKTVGLLTGDIKLMPEADVVVMTTEIFRNLLFKESTSTASVGTAGHLTMERLGAVIFDEVHYINDPDRGHVWEESLILMPDPIRVVMLSATMENPITFANWFGTIHRQPVTLLQTSHRVVPLVHGICVPEDPRFFIPYKTGDEAPFQMAVYYDYLKGKQAEADGADAWKKRVAAAQAAGESAGGLSGKVKVHAFPHVLNKAVEQLRDRKLLPALIFSFSRKKCEEYAGLVSQGLVTGAEAAAIRHQIGFHLAPYRAILEPIPQYHQIVRLLERGIAFHHSGMLPLLKEIVELLFTRGFIKTLFCTETFSVGLNMPTRTVVFTELMKPTEHGFRALKQGEYAQMAGRAGRRGKDTEGLVLYLPSRDPLAPEELRGVLCGGLTPLRSRMAFHYDFMLKALHKGVEWSRVLLSNSYGTHQRKARKAAVDAEIAKVEAQLAAIPLTEEHRKLAAEKATLDHEVATTRRGAHKRATEALAAWTAANPTWATTQKMLESEKGLVRKLEDWTSQAEGYAAENDVRRFEPVLESLVYSGYATNTEGVYALTPLGVLATECNEANPLLLSYLYDSEQLKGARLEEIVCVLASFLVDREAFEKSRRLEGPSALVLDTLHLLGQWTQEGIAADDYYRVSSPQDYWCTAPFWVEIIDHWLQGKSAAEICGRFGLMEGNFIKGVLKVNNIVREWKALATVRADVDMLATLDGVEPRLLHGIAVPESLYMRL